MSPLVAAAGAEVLTPAEVAKWLQLKPRQLIRYGVPHLRLGRRTVRYMWDMVDWEEEAIRLPAAKAKTPRGFPFGVAPELKALLDAQ